MKKLVAAAVMYLLCIPVSQSMGMFHRHHSDQAGARTSNTDLTFVPAIPEPDTYLMLIVGLVAVGWIIHKRGK